MVWTHAPVMRGGGVGGLLNSSKRGGDVAVPLLTVVHFFSVGEHQVGDGGLQPVS